MSEVTYYVASDDGVAPGDAVECFNPNSAVMKAEALSRKPGNMAQSRSAAAGIPQPATSATPR
jgi:hypothetical protein